MFNGLFDKLKSALGTGEEPRAAAEVNERMQRITAGEPFSGPKRRLPNLTGGSKLLTPEQIRAIRHEAERQRQESEARAVLGPLRIKLGKQKLETLAALPKQLEPAALAAFRKQHTQLTDAELAAPLEVLPKLDRDVLDDLARMNSFGPAEKEKLLIAIAEPQRVRLGEPTAALLEKAPVLVREALLRLPRIPSAKAVDALIADWKSLSAADVRAAAHALAQFGNADLPEAVKLPAPKKAK